MNRTDKRNNNNAYGYKALLFFIFSLIFSPAGAQAPAFPGAEGHGRYVTGGRGGTVVHVTNLNDSGTGSFRAAVTGGSNRIIVFDVAGVIALKSEISFKNNLTILGQTAPYPGITLRYYTVRPGANNIVRFIRFRRGQEKDVDDGADASWQRNKTGIILDHCSFSWSIDEVASYYDNNNFTMQWCTVGESLVDAGHGKGAHGYGGIWGGKLASFHHNMILHVANRSPRFNGARYDWKGYTGNKLYTTYKWENAVQAENVDFRNCIIYNANGCYGGPGGGQINMVGNYYKSGPAATIDRLTTVSYCNSGNASGSPTYWDMTSRYYLDGNLIDGKTAGWNKMRYDSDVPVSGGKYYTYDPNHYYGSNLTYTKVNGKDCLPIQLDEAAPTGEVTTHTAATAFEKVLSFAGASLYRDEVDERYATEARNGTATYTGSVTKKKGLIDKVSDCNGYTEASFPTGSREAGFDTDKDGMPDAWETANGLNPNSAADAKTYTLDPLKYYTNLEVYANSLVQDIMLSGNSEALETFSEYYPAYTKEDGTAVPAIGNNPSDDPEEGTPVSYLLSAATNTGANTSSSYAFENGITISNEKSKGYATGNNNGIKYSAGVQYTINLPADVTVNEVIFAGYDNYTDLDAYLGEVNGVEYDATTYVFPNTKEQVLRTVPLASPASGSLTFTPQGKQCVFSITLNGMKGTSTAIGTVKATAPRSDYYYNLQGQRVGATYQGVVIKNGKKLMVK